MGILGKSHPKALVLGVLSALLTCTASASDDKAPTRLVIGYASGGAMDAFARIIADGMKKHIYGPFIVESKPGASARMAIQHVKRQPADGKTILISSAPLFTVFPYTYRNLGYDADKDVIPVAHLVDIPLVLSTATSRPYKTPQEYINWVRKNPHDAGIGLITLGGPTQFGIATMAQSSGIDVVPTAYKGAAAMLTDAIGGSLSAVVDAVAGQLELQRSGRIRFLGVSGTQRSTIVPDVPTLAESGVKGFEMAGSWYAAFVPAGTSPEVVSRLEKVLLNVLQDPEVKDKLIRLGMEPTGLGREELRQQIAQQRKVWKPIVEASGFVADGM